MRPPFVQLYNCPSTNVVLDNKSEMGSRINSNGAGCVEHSWLRYHFETKSYKSKTVWKILQVRKTRCRVCKLRESPCASSSSICILVSYSSLSSSSSTSIRKDDDDSGIEISLSSSLRSPSQLVTSNDIQYDIKSTEIWTGFNIVSHSVCSSSHDWCVVPRDADAFACFFPLIFSLVSISTAIAVAFSSVDLDLVDSLCAIVRDDSCFRACSWTTCWSSIWSFCSRQNIRWLSRNCSVTVGDDKWSNIVLWFMFGDRRCCTYCTHCVNVASQTWLSSSPLLLLLLSSLTLMDATIMVPILYKVVVISVMVSNDGTVHSVPRLVTILVSNGINLGDDDVTVVEGCRNKSKSPLDTSV